jgi:hypothetical protein
LYEPNTFSIGERNRIISASTLEEKWKTALNISICKTYRIKYSNDMNLIIARLPASKNLIFNVLTDLIEKDLVPSIELRNRIAHGQWKQAFTNNLQKFSQPLILS